MINTVVLWLEVIREDILDIEGFNFKSVGSNFSYFEFLDSKRDSETSIKVILTATFCER